MPFSGRLDMLGSPPIPQLPWCLWCRKRLWPWQGRASRRFASGVEVRVHTSCVDAMDRRAAELGGYAERTVTKEGPRRLN